jgi:hypothetical protein
MSVCKGTNQELAFTELLLPLYHARYYNPAIARFVGPDTAALGQNTTL